MAEDREVLREIWEGRLPVCFTLAVEEIVATTPDPFYLMVPRITYFPLVIDKVRRHFVKYLSSEIAENEMWLEYEMQPLKWHYPVGVLYDINVPDQKLPWQIVVHFDKYPETKIMRCPSKDVVESHFMSSLKEADALKHKNSIMSEMQERDHKQLWLGLLHDKFDQFWSVNRKLMDKPSGEDFRYIPFRLYVQEITNKPFIQFLIKPSTEDKRATLNDLLSQARIILQERYSVITHGIIIPLDTPLQWMSEHLSYPDNFLHLFIKQEAT